MNQDVILTTVKGYGWPEMMAFVVSVERSGFSGAKVMFAENVKADATERLPAKGWEIVNVVADPAQSYATARHIPVRDFLDAHKDEYRYALYIDVRDAVLQSNPSKWLEDNLPPHKLVGASECMLIKDQSINYDWIRASLGDEIVGWLKEYDVICCGTMIGTPDALADLLREVCKLSEKRTGWGFDQAYVNYLLRIDPFKDITRFVRTTDGFILTCSWYLSCPDYWRPWVNAPAPVFDQARVLACAPGSDVPYPILHQYDRSEWWRDAVQGKYAE